MVGGKNTKKVNFLWMVKMETSETRWFKILSFVGIAFIVGFAIANLIYYVRLNSGQIPTKNEVVAMIWVNAILLFFAAILFIWTLIRLLTTSEFRTVAKAKTIKYLNETNSGVITPLLFD